jgi:hypothetical protein
MLQQKNASIARLRRLLFGARTERTRQVVPPDTPSEAESAAPRDG